MARARKKSTGKRTIKKTAPKRKAPRKSVAKKKRRATRTKTTTIISVRRSSGRKEKFDVDRMAQTTGRSGVPFLMARDVAKNVSKKIKSEAKAGRKEKTVTAGRVRNMIAKELQDRNQKTMASSYAGEAPENTQKDDMAFKVEPHEQTVGSADTDQHEAYRADRDSVMHDRSKRYM